MRRKQNKGLTLFELLTTLGISGIFSLSLLSIFTISNGYWKHGNEQSAAQSNARVSFQVMTNELKQALPDADPGGANPPTGYLSISPAVQPTGVLTPNANTTTSTKLIFTEPNTANYTPFVVGWIPTTPSNFKRIQYSIVNSNLLQRIETTYNANGSVATTRTDQVLVSKNGTLQLQCTFLASNLFNLNIVSNESGKTHQLLSNIFIEQQ